MTPTITVVMPVLNEAHTLESTLGCLPKGAEVIVVDGGSSDSTLDRASQAGATVIHATRSRSRQMNAGAHIANGDVIVFVHADTLLPSNFSAEMDRFWASDCDWGRFDVRLSGEQTMFRVIEFMMNRRSRLTGICTGDQAIFVRRAAFEEAGGFADIPLMEDIEFSKRMKRQSAPFCSPAYVFTSSRRWEQNGIWQTILTMWWLRLLYFVGVSPNWLVKRYYPSRATSGATSQSRNA